MILELRGRRCYLALPLSIVWAGAKCGGADFDDSGAIGLVDLWLFAQRWLDYNCVPPDWCGGADLNYALDERGEVGFEDFAIIALHWFDPTCNDP